MTRRTHHHGALLSAIVLFTATFASPPPIHAQPEPDARPGNTHPIRLRTGNVDPAAFETLSVSDAAAGGRFIVQFSRPVSETDAAALETSGAQVTGYLPDFAFSLRVPDGRAIPEVEGVTSIIPFLPEWRLSPSLSPEAGTIRITVDDGVDPRGVATEISEAGLEITRISGHTILAVVDGTVPSSVSSNPAVAWVEPYRLAELHNDAAGSIVGAPTAHGLGYDGSTQIVAVADSGLGSASIDSDQTDGVFTGSDPHPDIPASRIVEIVDYPAESGNCGLPGADFTAIPDGPQDPDSGHGTHTTGSAVSDGGAGGIGTGVAPAARLVFQAVEDYADMNAGCEFLGLEDGYYLLGIPTELGPFFEDAYDLGARIHSDSWGSDAAGEYTADSAAADGFTFDNPDFLIVTSAGNAGIDGDSDGLIDDDSIGSPATAKNVVSVGASEGERNGGFACDATLTYPNSDGDSCSSLGGDNQIFTYGEPWPDDFGADPLFSDLSAGDAEQMAAFSSRGPTDDGRIKPDVVAPGTWIASTYSPLFQEGYGVTVNPQNSLFQFDGWGFPLDTDYKYLGGTSMAAPIVAGGAAVVRDFYNQAHGTDASAALTKATLINSAVDLADENNDGADDNDYPIPNSHEGWGRIDLAAATDGSHVFIDNQSVSTGGSISYAVVVAAPTALRATLVWSDAPAAGPAAPSIVNDLDMVVTAPDGTTTYVGNNFSGGWTVSGGSADRANNVENVYVETATAGTWTIRISGFNVPAGPQPFALVVDGAEFPAAPAWPGDASLVTKGVFETRAELEWTEATDDGGVVRYDVIVDSSTPRAVGAAVVASTNGETSLTVSGLSPATTYVVRIEAIDGDDNQSSGGPTVEFSTAVDFVDTNGHIFEDDIAWMSARSITQGCPPDGSAYCPADSLSRAQMASLLARAFDLPAVAGNRFTDVLGVHTANINAIAEAGITIGCNTDGTQFCPDDIVSRGQMASFLDRAFVLPDAASDFFTDDAASTHQGAINSIAEANITLGCAPSLYCPADEVNRGQIAALIHRGFVELDLE